MGSTFCCAEQIWKRKVEQLEAMNNTTRNKKPPPRLVGLLGGKEDIAIGDGKTVDNNIYIRIILTWPRGRSE